MRWLVVILFGALTARAQVIGSGVTLGSGVQLNCTVNQPYTLCAPNQTLATVPISGTNPPTPPAINGIFTDPDFGGRILRVTGVGFDNRSSGAATNDSYGINQLHYEAFSSDDSAFWVQGQFGEDYFLTLNTSTFQSALIPCSYDASAGNILQKGTCQPISSDGSGQKYLINNSGGSPNASNIYEGNIDFSRVTPKKIFFWENGNAGGVRIFAGDITPTINNQANPPTLLNSGSALVDPWNGTPKCFPAGTTTSLLPGDLELSFDENVIQGYVYTGNLGTGVSWTIAANLLTGHCYALRIDPNGSGFYTDGANLQTINFVKPDGTTAWGASPTVTDKIHSSQITPSGQYVNFIIPSNWDSDVTHCNPECNYYWVVGTPNVITLEKPEGHGWFMWNSIGKRQSGPSNQSYNTFLYSAPTLANRKTIIALSGGITGDSHFDMNTATSTDQQYWCGTSYDATQFGSPGAAETITYPFANEVYCMNARGQVWRLAHIHASGQETWNFGGAQAYLSMSRSGKYLLFGSGWGGLLKDNTGATCTVWANCRTDMWIAETNAHQ